MKLPYRTAAGIEDALSFERLITSCFAFPPEHTGPWIQRIGLENVRLLGPGSRAPAALAILPMGQWFGGRRVSCAGIAAVGVAPERRGEGLGKQLMSSMLVELAEKRTALSCLYPATLPIYRGVGYEIAGGRYETRMSVAALAGGTNTLAITPIESFADESMRACQTEAARASNGMLDRPPPMWARVGEHRGETREGYAARDAQGRVHAYLWYARRHTGIGFPHDLVLSDLCALNRDGALALAGFLHRHRSIVRDAVWNGGAHDVFRDALGEVGGTTSLASAWMIRIVDVERAFMERGFAPALSGTLELEIEDTLLPRNHGRFVLTVEKGATRVERGGSGRVFVPITDLAPIFTSYASAQTRARFGRVRGSEGDLALLSSSVRRTRACHAGHVLANAMSVDVECSSVRDDELALCDRILSTSFERDAPRELTRSLDSDVCVLREAGVVRGLVIVRDRRVGFGGRFVRAACLSSLCVDGPQRSRGLGTRLVASTLRAAYARGIGAAILIPRAEELYARLGFTRAGARCACSFDLLRGPASRGPETVRSFTRRDENDRLALAEEAARERNGCVIPTASDHARRSRAPREAYVVERDGAVVACMTVSQRLEDRRMTLYVHELLALDRAAAGAAWAFVTGFSAQVRHVRWRAASTDPLADFALEARARFEERGTWMLRLVDARRFLAERGYAHGGAFEFTFALADPLLPANERPFTLVVEAGVGRVHEGGRGALVMDCTSAASLFAGVTSASRLQANGRLSAGATELERLDAAFVLQPSSLQSLP